MDVKQAVGIAKRWLVDVLDDEQIINLGLEEVEHDATNGVWTITLGFTRPWLTTRNLLSGITGDPSTRRDFRTLTVDSATGEVKGMKRFEVHSD